MQHSINYKVATQFSRFPGGRKRSHGRNSGEEFRDTVTIPLLQQYEFVTFDLSGSAGYSSGFLDEAFGELGAVYAIEELRRRVTIIADDDPDAVDIAWARIADAARERGR